MSFFRLVPVCLTLLTACDNNQVAAPPPAELTSDATGYYCSMTLAEHPGPKAQIFAGDAAEPAWFPSVRDMFAYTMLPEENQNIRAIYVSDTGASDDVSIIRPGAWVDAKAALYVLGSDATGGMGLPELVPFADRKKADAFAIRHGGEVVTFEEVTPDHIFTEFEADPPAAGVTM
ncbi:MAG: nitrous oxide reductase accessory protein NosL [Alphaproteobacteria bacterium]